MFQKLVNKVEPPKKLLSAEPIISPSEGTKMTLSNLHPGDTKEDVEIFCMHGALKWAQLVRPQTAEVAFVTMPSPHRRNITTSVCTGNP